MNITAQLCGLIIISLLVGFYNRLRKVGTRSEIVFSWVLNMILFCDAMDILSIIGITYRAYLPDLLVNFICKLYIASLVWITCLGLNYSGVDIYHGRWPRRMAVLAQVFLSGITILIFALPIHIYQEGRIAYTYGPSTIVTYAGALGFILATTLFILRHWNAISPARRKVVLLWMGIWMAAALIQMLFPQILAVSFAAVVGCTIMFIELENPEASIDKSTGCFNVHSFWLYVQEQYQSGQAFALVVLTQQPEAKISVAAVVALLEKLPNARIFKNGGDEFFILWNNREEWKIPEIPGWDAIAVPDSRVVDGATQLSSLLQYAAVFRIQGETIVIDEKFAEEKRNRDSMEQELKAAMEEDRVEVFYQPIYSLQNQSFTSAEALVRIRRKDGSLIPPMQFVPIAESTGLIQQLGRLVLQKTCRFIRENDLLRQGIEYIEVNLSVKQCEDKQLAAECMEILDKERLDAGAINLEITETASVRSEQILLENMQLLIDCGMSFSLDDFGTGRSNLNYIMNMPVSIVKFDRSFTQAYFTNEKARAVLSGTIETIKNLGLKIVAEGVETEHELNGMGDAGVDYIQGYYFSKPLPAFDFLDFIREKNRVSGMV